MAYLTTATLKFSSLAIAVTIANAAGAYPQKGGQAELAWVAGIARWFSCPKAVTHPTTGRARRRATPLTETNALTLVVKLRDRQLAYRHVLAEVRWNAAELSPAPVILSLQSSATFSWPLLHMKSSMFCA